MAVGNFTGDDYSPLSDFSDSEPPAQTLSKPARFLVGFDNQ